MTKYIKNENFPKIIKKTNFLQMPPGAPGSLPDAPEAPKALSELPNAQNGSHFRNFPSVTSSDSIGVFV